MDPLYWPQPGWVHFQLLYLEVPGLLVTILQFFLVQCYKEIQYLPQNKMSTCDMCSAWSCFNSRESGFAVTNENKITLNRTNILRMYFLNCCFGLNNIDDFDNYESSISGEPYTCKYMWRNQDDHWDVTLDFNLYMWDSTMNWYSSSIGFGDYTDLLWWKQFKQIVLPIDH